MGDQTLFSFQSTKFSPSSKTPFPLRSSNGSSLGINTCGSFEIFTTAIAIGTVFSNPKIMDAPPPIDPVPSTILKL